jgi:hypothetical protein
MTSLFGLGGGEVTGGLFCGNGSSVVRGGGADVSRHAGMKQQLGSFNDYFEVGAGVVRAK